MDFTDLSAALSRAKERAGATSTADSFLAEFLDLSSALDAAGVRHYRPYIAAARWLEQDLGGQRLKRAKDGIEFTGLVTPIASLMVMQAAYDVLKGLIVPPGFEAVTAAAETAIATTLPRWGSTSVRRTPRP